MGNILVATHNKIKFQEYESLLSQVNFGLVKLSDIGIGQVHNEIGDSYLDIAKNKAEFYSKYSKLPLIADTSGLEIHALRGFPGIYSHRWMKGTFKEINNSLLERMSGAKDRLANLLVVIIYLNKKNFVYFEGKIKVEIAYKAQGVLGFGYDPIIYIPEKKRTLAQIPLFERNQISHRALALQKLASFLRKYKPPS